MHTFRCHEQNYRILADVYTLIYTYTEPMQTQSSTINTVEICRRAALAEWRKGEVQLASWLLGGVGLTVNTPDMYARYPQRCRKNTKVYSNKI